MVRKAKKKKKRGKKEGGGGGLLRRSLAFGFNRGMGGMDKKETLRKYLTNEGGVCELTTYLKGVG